MKYFISLVIAIEFFLNQASAQKDTIHFEHGTWQEVLTIARKSSKPIYVDFYTTWCGPCKLMASKFFKDSTAASVYNGRFVNYKLDAEKGEGITLAKKYDVTGYPTNVFIEPATEKLIYKTSGCPLELSGFLDNANIAMAERSDSMNVDEYIAKFKSNNYDSLFLKKYIQKNDRIGLNNNAAVDTFLAKYTQGYSDSSLLIFISTYNNYVTATSQAFQKILQLKDNKELPSDRIDQLIHSMTYNTVEYAEKTFKEADFYTAAYYMKNYYDDGYDYMFDTWSEYRLAQNNMFKLKELYKEYGAYFYDKSDTFIEKRNKEILENNVQKQIQIAQIVDKEQNPSEANIRAQLIKDGRDKLYSTRVADNLNTICWTIYEKMPTDTSMVKTALPWAKRALEVSIIDTETWIGIADTYARLLATVGRKKEAIAVMQDAIKKGKEIKFDGLTDYENYLKELKK